MATTYIEQFLKKAKRLSRWWIIEGIITISCLTFIIVFFALEDDNKITQLLFGYLGIQGTKKKLILFVFIYYLISIALGIVCTVKYFKTINAIDKIYCATNESKLKKYLKREKIYANLSFFLSYLPIASGFPIFYIFSLFSKFSFTKTLSKIKVCDSENA